MANTDLISFLMKRLGINCLKYAYPTAFFIALLGLPGCDQTPMEEYLPGNIRGNNHTGWPINYFRINGYGGANMTGYGYETGYCCASIPAKWRPGILMYVEWEADTTPESVKDFPGYHDRVAYRAWVEKARHGYKKFQKVVELEPYGDKVCGPIVHILPCGNVRVLTSCSYELPEGKKKVNFAEKYVEVCEHE